MRIRTVKPEFFIDSKIAALPPLCRIFFQGLWCTADREGRLEDKPAELKVTILPYDSGVNVEKFLNLLNEHGFIIRYGDNTIKTKYIQIVNFLKHQRPNNKENQSVIPSLNLDKASLNLDKASLNPELVEGKGKEGKGKGKDKPPLSPFAGGDNKLAKLDKSKNVTPECLQKLKLESTTVDVDSELVRFSDYCTANGKKYRDYDAAFRNWIRSPYQKLPKAGYPKKLTPNQETYRRLREKQQPPTDAIEITGESDE